MSAPVPPRNAPYPQTAAPPPLPGGNATLASYGALAMGADADGSTAKSTKVWTPYVTLWAALAIGTVGYLAYVLATPEARLAGGSAYDARFASRVVTDVANIKDAITQIQTDLSKVKSELSNQDQRSRVLSAAVTALELRLPGETQAALPPAAPGQTAATGTGRAGESAATAKTAPATKAAAAAPEPAPAATAKPAPDKARIVNAPEVVGPADLGLNLETGSVASDAAEAAKPQAGAKATQAAAPAIDFGTAVVKPAPKPVGVQISSGASVDSLRLSWSLLSDRHSDTLKNLEPRYIARGDEAAPTYDLIVGPIKSKADAQKVCKSLAAKNVPCKIGDFLGDAL